MLYNDNPEMVTKEMLSDKESLLWEKFFLLDGYAEANERRAEALQSLKLDNWRKFVKRAQAAKLFKEMILLRLDWQSIPKDIFKCIIEDFFDLCSSTIPTFEKLSKLFEIC